MSSRNERRTELISKLPQLQNLVKRDPEGYRDEFLMQHRHYESELQIFLLNPNPSKDSCHFSGLVSFLSHVATCYPNELKDFPSELTNLLERHYAILESGLRKSLVQSLILLRNRNVILAGDLMKLFFKLFRCQDKALRELMYNHIVNDLKNLNKNGCDQKINTALQTTLYGILQNEEDDANAQRALDILIALYRSKYWMDEKTVNVIATACLSKNTKIMVTAMQFFLDVDRNIMEDDEEKEKDEHAQEEVNYHSHSKKTRKRHRQTKMQLAKNKRARNKDSEKKTTFPANFLINDPQGLIEKVFRSVKTSNERFEIKLLIMSFISNLICSHQLILLNFYPYLQRYLNSHQQNVTNILTCLVQSCHSGIPAEELQSIIKTIAHNFITERCSSAVMAVGINSLREIVGRVPLVLECEGMDTLVSDLVMYSKSKDKSIMIAARSIINLIREIYPSILEKKQRGKYYTDAKPAQFGELIAAEGVDGAELLEENVQGEQKTRIDAQRILTQEDFEQIQKLKKKAKEDEKDPKNRRKHKRSAMEEINNQITPLQPEDLEGYAKKQRMTLEQRLEHVIQGRKDFVVKRTGGGGTTNTEKIRKKHFLMLRKSRNVQQKVRRSARNIQHIKNKQVKVALKHEKRKKRRL